jgi:23S rRNA pseudouridine2605 synthase
MEKQERLQKIIASAGLASRRKAELLIQEGRVTVNGTVVTQLGAKADADRDHIKVDGKLIREASKSLYTPEQTTRGLPFLILSEE